MHYTFPQFATELSQCFTTKFVGVEALTNNEGALVKNAGKKRIADFSTGRFCAKMAMETIGIFNAEILTGTGREPLWPQGIVGSISHSKKLVGAVVSPANKMHAVGLDIETMGNVKREMWDLLYTAPEQKFLSALSNEELELFTTLLFSLKESFYKFQYPITKLYLDFKDVEVHYINETFRLNVITKLSYPNNIPLKLLNFQWVKFEDQIISLCYLNKL
jgi:4'-phosphopantetheinyl transferase EntD